MFKKKLYLNGGKQIPETDYLYPKSVEEFNSILNDVINNFFPSTGEWKPSCFSRPNETLQSNLRNNKLLAKMILYKANLAQEYYKKVLDFINNSDLFKEKVHEYEQTIVKWQIEFIMNNGENWITDKKLGGDFCMMMPDCDIAFRKGVRDTLLAIGLDKEAIEEGLEKNARMWRDIYIEKAFRNKFEPIICDFYVDFGFDSSPVERKPFEPLPAVSLEHKQAWIRMRKYEYYCEHKESVVLYGDVEPDMLLTQEELSYLKSYLDIEEVKRLKVIEIYENQGTRPKIEEKRSPIKGRRRRVFIR